MKLNGLFSEALLRTARAWRPSGVLATGRERETMAKEFKKGDKVVWSSHGSHDTPGTVERKLTSDTEAAGRKVKASKDDPQYLVRSEKGGGQAVHEPSALQKRSS